MTDLQEINGPEAWIDYLEQTQNHVGLTPAKAGDKDKQAKLAVRLSADCSKPVTAYGAPEDLRRIGQALPALIAHSGETVFFTKLGSFQPVADGLLKRYRSVRRLSNYLKGMGEFFGKIMPKHAASILGPVADKCAGQVAQFDEMDDDNRPGILFWNPSHEVNYSAKQITAHAMELDKKDIQADMMTARDDFLTTLAHEATHLKLAHCAPADSERYQDNYFRFMFDNKDQYGELNDDDLVTIYILAKEIAADRGAIDFHLHNPDLFQCLDIRQTLLTKASQLTDPHALTHATGLALENQMPPAYGTDESFAEAAQTYLAYKNVQTALRERLGEGQATKAKNLIPHVQEMLADQRFPEGSPEHKLLSQFIDGIDAVAPALLRPDGGTVTMLSSRRQQNQSSKPSTKPPLK